MKKAFLLICMMCLVAVFGLALTACNPTEEHTHTFDETKWEHDADNHWHKATCEHTDEVKDKAAHTFEWKSNETKHWQECICGEKKGEADHTYDENGVCVCGKKQHTHNYSEQWSSNETKHWHECECGAKKDEADHEFENGKCKTCGYEQGHTHTYSEQWSSNETKHWHECECGAKKDEANHEFENGKCKTCGYEQGHTHTYSDQWSSNETKHWHECTCGNKKDEANHEFENGKCKICNYEHKEHTYSEQWSSNETKHWHECTVCGAKNDEADHNFTDGECECGRKQGGNTPENPTVKLPASLTGKYIGVAHNEYSIIVEGLKFTVTMSGQTLEFTVAAYANGKVTFEENSNYVSECDYNEEADAITFMRQIFTKTGKHDHLVDNENWKVDATNHWHECKVCGNQVDKAAHTFGDDGVCDICNYSDNGEYEDETFKYTYSKSKKTATIVGYKATDANVVIPEKVNINNDSYTVTAIGENAFKSENNKIESILIPKSITSIGSHAFGNCNLKYLILGSNITTNIDNMDKDAFADATFADDFTLYFDGTEEEYTKFSTEFIEANLWKGLLDKLQDKNVYLKVDSSTYTGNYGVWNFNSDNTTPNILKQYTEPAAIFPEGLRNTTWGIGQNYIAIGDNDFNRYYVTFNEGPIGTYTFVRYNENAAEDNIIVESSDGTEEKATWYKDTKKLKFKDQTYNWLNNGETPATNLPSNLNGEYKCRTSYGFELDFTVNGTENGTEVTVKVLDSEYAVYIITNWDEATKTLTLVNKENHTTDTCKYDPDTNTISEYSGF